VGRLLVAAPLRLEAALIRSGAPGVDVRATGMGRERSLAAVDELAAQLDDGLLVLGFCGGLDATARPGDVVVAEQVWAADEHGDGEGAERIRCDHAAALAAAVAGWGMRVRSGAVVSVPKIAVGERRAQLHAAGAIAVDMESAWLAAAARGRPFGVVRVVLDSPSHELFRPGIAIHGPRAALALRRVAGAAVRGWVPGQLR
jgi:4-hydroxy-3-methylbut-2-en-1-yl diphosphate reductase